MASGRKGACDISLAMLAAHGEGVQLVLLPRDLDQRFTVEVESNVVAFPAREPREETELETGIVRALRLPLRDITGSFEELLPHLVRLLPTLRHLGAAFLYTDSDIGGSNGSMRSPGRMALASSPPMTCITPRPTGARCRT